MEIITGIVEHEFFFGGGLSTIGMCLVLTGIIILVGHFVWPVSGRQLRRVDCFLVTTLGGAGIGAVLMCGDPHTVLHGAVEAFSSAAVVGAAGSLLAGTVGRLIGILIPYGRRHEAFGRWIGNVFAFAAPLFFVPMLALA